MDRPLWLINLEPNHNELVKKKKKQRSFDDGIFLIKEQGVTDVSLISSEEKSLFHALDRFGHVDDKQSTNNKPHTSSPHLVNIMNKQRRHWKKNK